MHDPERSGVCCVRRSGKGATRAGGEMLRRPRVSPIMDRRWNWLLGGSIRLCLLREWHGEAGRVHPHTSARLPVIHRRAGILY